MNSASKAYRAAVIGCGRIAGGYDRFSGGAWAATHAGGYRRCRSAALVAAADPDPTARAGFGERWGLDRLYGDYREMLERERPDIVSVCLPTKGHFGAFRAACEAGARAIFLEKPVAADVVEARRMAELAGGRPVAVNYFRRWNPSLQALRGELAGGGQGRPLRAAVRYVKGLAENGSHWVDLLRWFFGEPVGFRVLRAYEEPAEDPAADFELDFGGGLLAVFLHLPEVDYVFHEVDILTDRGRVTIAQRGQELARSGRVEEPHYRRFDILRAEGAPQETEWRDCPARAVEELVGCIEGGGRPSCALADGIRALEICADVLAEAAALQPGGGGTR